MPHHDVNGGAFPGADDRALAAGLASSFRHATRYFMAPATGAQGVLVELRGDLFAPAEPADDPVPDAPTWTS